MEENKILHAKNRSWRVVISPLEGSKFPSLLACQLYLLNFIFSSEEVDMFVKEKGVKKDERDESI